MDGYVREAILSDEVTDYPVSVISGDRLAIGSSMVASFIRRPDGKSAGYAECANDATS